MRVNNDGYFLTNAHVVDRCKRMQIGSVGGEIAATVVYADAENDIAVLKADLKGSVAVFSGVPAELGSTVVAAGFPYKGILGSQATISVGNVANLSGLLDDSRMLQVSCPVQPGNSGGPLLDAHGLVAGIVVSKLNAALIARATGSLPENVNFAIKSTVATSALDAAGIQYQLASSSEQLEIAEVSQRARNVAVAVQCLK